MKRSFRRLLRHPRLAFVKRLLLLGRGLFFVGWRYRCPCCRWPVRGFVGRRGLLRPISDGLCPRCNSKARHRRIWIYLNDRAALRTVDRCILEVGPWWSFAPRFRRMTNVEFVGLDRERVGPQVTVVGDAAAAPLRSEVFDLALCIHVLEHVPDDRGVIAELYRVVKPGGFAVVSVPLRFDRPTHEDPTITDPVERLRLFGERGHVRYYGLDLRDRLADVGFDVHLDPASGVPEETRRRFGLRTDENIFHCVKPSANDAP